jgi:hypothetical protein
VKRLAILVGLTAILNLALISPVLAAAPANDTYDGAIAIVAVPFSDSVDTTEATTDANDVEMNPEECGAPATDASVWYQLTLASDAFLIVDVSASSYTAGLIVATGSPGGFSFVTCGPSAVVFEALAGETYTILAFDDQQDGGGNGGTLEITVDTAPPPPEVDVTVDGTGHFDAQSGSATITGTVTCSGVADFSFIDVELRQTVGRFVVSGFGSTDFTCDGTTQAWSVEIFPDSGLFKGGRAVAVTFAVACGAIDCGEDFEEQIVRLRR